MICDSYVLSLGQQQQNISPGDASEGEQNLHWKQANAKFCIWFVVLSFASSFNRIKTYVKHEPRTFAMEYVSMTSWQLSDKVVLFF